MRISKEEFDNLTDIQQWLFVIENKKDISLDLDNDTTSFYDENQDEIFTLKADIGNRNGAEIVLGLIGIKAEPV